MCGVGGGGNEEGKERDKLSPLYITKIMLCKEVEARGVCEEGWCRVGGGGGR